MFTFMNISIYLIALTLAVTSWDGRDFVQSTGDVPARNSKPLGCSAPRSLGVISVLNAVSIVLEFFAIKIY